MRRSDIPPDWAGSLAERSRQGLAAFDAEPKGYAFDDSGDGTTYAGWFADLLQEWVDQRDRAYAALCGPPARSAVEEAAGPRYGPALMVPSDPQGIGEPCPDDPGARHVG